MIAANELRVGNWYTSTKWQKPVRCELSDIAEIHHRLEGAEEKYANVDEIFQSIPLSEEWLQKLGFTNKDDLNWWDMPGGNNHKAHHIMQMVNAWTWFIDFDDTGDNTHLVKGFNYVHELQNLCFVLTGEELTITE